MNYRKLGELLLLMTVVMPTTDIKAGSTPESALVINEIMPANVDMFLDPSMNYGSWIEIYNPGTTDVNISGWYLSNDSTDIRQCPLGTRSRIVKAKGFLTLWCGHLDDYCLDQLDFKLEYEGGVVILSDKDGNRVSTVAYKTVPARISYARKTDGGSTWGFTGNPTPGATNASSSFATDQIPAPSVSVDSRLFTEQFYFSVTIPDGATLYYTKDGSTPTPDNPNVKTSSGSHTVTSTKTYRFRLYKDGMLPSAVVTRSYIMTDNAYGVPVVSIVTDNDGLYSSEYGLWAKGPNGKSGNGQNDLCNWNRDWDRSVNIEIIDVNGSMIINQEAEITPSGRWSRAYDPHPFKIEAKKKYGYDNFFAFTPFSDKPYNKYQTLKFRSGGNNYTTRLKDAALQEIILRSGLDVDCQSYQPVHHYINGVYKGIINIREPNNKDYAYSNYGFDEDEVDCFKLDHNNGNGGFKLTQGSRDTWDEWLELSKNASNADTYNRISQIVDIEEFINYMAIEFYLANQDWPRNNIKSFRHNTDGRFRFVVFDLDHAFGSINRETDIEPFTFFDSEEYYSGDKTGYKSVMVTLFHNMLKNDTFRKKFIDSFCIVAGSVFAPNRVSSIVNELASRAKQEMSFKNESPSADANLIVNTINDSYRTKRTNQLASWSYAKCSSDTKIQIVISTNLPQATLTLNGLKIPTGEFAGYVFLPGKVAVTAPDGYIFKGWKNDYNNTIIGTDKELVLNSRYQSITACFESSGNFKRPVRINEVSADNSVFINDSFKKHDWLELYNTTSASINIGGMYLSDDLSDPDKYKIPQGTTIPANGHLVIWCDKESGTQLHAPFKLGNKETNYVTLTASDHSWADTLEYVRHTGYQSVGLYPDGGNNSYVMNLPSIGKKNILSSYDLLDKENITGIKSTFIDQKTDVIYNLLGQPVQTPQPGQMYIKNGHKYIHRP